MPTLPFRTLSLATALALIWPLPALAALPPGAAAEILSLQRAGDQRTASATAWQPAAA